MEKYNDDYYKNILARLLRVSLTNAEPAKALIEQMFGDDDFKEQAKYLCDAYMKKENRDSKLIAKTIDIRALNALVKICKRDKFGIIPLDFTGEENRVYEQGDKINILILSKQESEFEKAALEACAISGAADEISRRFADLFAKKLKDENPLMEINGVSENVYKSMKDKINKLPYSLRFTLIPNKKSDGKLDVGFFAKTEPVMIKKGKRTEKDGPFFVPKIASVVLACSLLENPQYDKDYEKKLKRNKEIMNAILEYYYGTDDPFYLVPATIGKDGILNVFMDRCQFYDIKKETCPDYLEFNEYVQSKSSGMNHTLIPMTEKEYESFKHEITLNPATISFYKKVDVPIYMPTENMHGKQISENLIDILNKKREQIMLMSDDFNGNNLINLDNYISGTVHELIMREDEDYTDWIESDELLDEKEMKLLSELEKSYTISYAYEEHDKVAELINTEKQLLESFNHKGKEEREDMEL